MNKLFPILSLETTGEMCSVSVMLDEKVFVELNYLQKHIHSQKLIDMIDTVLLQSEIKIAEVKSVAVSTGPGSFTGLRIGVAAAKGLAFGSSLPIIPVPTFDAFALQVSECIPAKKVFNLITNASIDDVYCAKYVWSGAKLETLNHLELIKRDMLNKFLLDEEINFGNTFAEGAEIRNVQIRASYIGRWAYLFGSDLLTFDYYNLEPNYIKQFVGKVTK
ncbi:MAG: tRNA (adenosine(37)-N6)-threonylcarbamoyltransferase complex dimerization subunit type 1 TsaB [Ignavibacteriales bacterium]|nr:tRNA (adenosine(37)-N6)-threonylcarbamoyltransferase complex dimerization subunit type 1 TsaB [Ignavibacteriales bacterium]